MLCHYAMIGESPSPRKVEHFGQYSPLGMTLASVRFRQLTVNDRIADTASQIWSAA